jgi:hypothetical protein
MDHPERDHCNYFIINKTCKMSEQDMYDKEVRRIAEVLAKVYHGLDLWDFENLSTQERIINSHLDQARAMVAEMAKQYENAYFSNYPGDEDSEDYVLWNQNCIYEMQERGLIPSPSKATGSDTGKK